MAHRQFQFRNFFNGRRSLAYSLSFSKSASSSSLQKRQINQFENKSLSRLYREDCLIKRLRSRSISFSVLRAGFNSLDLTGFPSEIVRSGEDDDGT